MCFLCFNPLVAWSLSDAIVASAWTNLLFNSSYVSLAVDLTCAMLGTGIVDGAVSGSLVSSGFVSCSSGRASLVIVVSSCGEEYAGGGASGVASTCGHFVSLHPYMRGVQAAYPVCKAVPDRRSGHTRLVVPQRRQPGDTDFLLLDGRPLYRVPLYRAC